MVRNERAIAQYRVGRDHVPDPTGDSKNDSSPPAIIPNERLHNGDLPPGFGNGTSSENNSLPHTRGTNMQLSGTLAPGFRKESGSRNDSSQSQNNRMPDDKLLYGLLAPGIDERSCVRRHQS
ncbi:hypothetical protein H0E87_003380 [Populus deltoides]|uniref:Uncharacterized protein n=1 Tax=Populus deltoides TaxID=3696 RepID=A0A8T2ZZF7_POPDE|nr:hypothetical protein H0E87_003380 [Populus deltoides]